MQTINIRPAIARLKTIEQVDSNLQELFERTGEYARGLGRTASQQIYEELCIQRDNLIEKEKSTGTKPTN